jgi:hypothetical protein
METVGGSAAKPSRRPNSGRRNSTSQDYKSAGHARSPRVDTPFGCYRRAWTEDQYNVEGDLASTFPMETGSSPIGAWIRFGRLLPAADSRAERLRLRRPISAGLTVRLGTRGPGS